MNLKICLLTLIFGMPFFTGNASTCSCLVNKLTASFAKEIKQNQGLELIGKGGSIGQDIKSLDMHFISYNKVDIKQARIVFVDVAQKFINKVNTNSKIQPYLHELPFTSKNIDLAISFVDEKKSHHKDGSITLVSIVDGMICYAYFDSGTGRLEKAHREPYEEALKIVQDQKNLTLNEKLSDEN